MNMTNALENKLLDGLLGVAPYTAPATPHLALFQGDPTDTGDVSTEVSGVGYSRVSLPGYFSAATGASGVSVNTTIIPFSAAGAGGWGTVTHIGIMESSTGGTDDMMLHGVLNVATDILESDVYELQIGNLTLTLA